MSSIDATSVGQDAGRTGSIEPAPADRGTTGGNTGGKKPRIAGYFRVLTVVIAYLALVGYFAVTGLQEHVRASHHVQTQAAKANAACPPGTTPPAGQSTARLAPRGTPVEVIA